MAEKRHEQLGLSDETVFNMYEAMLLARKIDERMWLLNRAGKIPFVVSCQGQEAAQIGAAFALDRAKDYIAPYYRDLGLVLSFGMSTQDIMLSGFAKAEDPNSAGRQMPGHFGQKKNRIMTQSSPVTTQVAHAVGAALGGRMRGEDIVALTTFGEGSSNQGDFHESANFAGVHQLPVIFMCENNKYAISVPIKKQLACEQVSDRAAGYGMHGVTVDGNDPLSVYDAIKGAADRARAGKGPSLIETVSYRLTPHSSDDDDRAYREKTEVDEAKEKDGIILFAQYLRDNGVMTEDKENDLQERIKRLVDEATDYAENARYAEPESALKYVYEE